MQKFINKTVWLLLVSIAILYSATSLADSSPLSQNMDIFKPPSTDASMQVLASIFGKAGGVLSETKFHLGGGVIFGGIFNKFNQGMLVIALLVAIYTMFYFILNSVQEGRILGGRISAGKSAFRILTGFSLLVPLPKFGGYSFIQVFVMWVVVHGIGFADTAWSYVIDRLTQGEALFVGVPKSTQAIQYVKVIKKASEVLRGAVCLEGFQLAAERSKDPYFSKLQFKARKGVSGQGSDDGVGPAPKAFYFGTKYPGKVIPDIGSDSYGVCGVLEFGNVAAGEDDGKNIYRLMKESALKTMIINSMPLAKKIAKDFNEKGALPEYENFKTQYVRVLLDSTVNFYTVMKPAATALTSSVDRELADNLIDAKRRGWILAGAYYRDIAKINENAFADFNKLAEINFVKPAPSSLDDYKDWMKANPVEAKIITNAMDGYQNIQSQYQDEVTPLVKNVMERGKAAEQGHHGIGIKDYWKWAVVFGAVAGGGMTILPTVLIVLAPIAPLLAPFAHTTMLVFILPAMIITISGIFLEGLNKVGDPILIMTTHGYHILTFLFWGFFAATLINYIAHLASNLLSAVLPVGAALSSVSNWMLAIIIPVMMALATSGFLMGVYTPFIPFMLFFFASVGWIISVIEAMVAAPLVAIGVTHPEGHDILGKSEQALMLLLGVFLRPILMIIGFVAAMVLGRAILTLMNEGFIITMNSINITSYTSVMDTGGLVVAGTVMLYSLFMVSVVNMVYSLVHVLPDRVMKWLGMSPDQSMVDQQMSQVKQGVEQGAGVVGKSMGAGTKGAGAMAGAAALGGPKGDSGGEGPGGGSDGPAAEGGAEAAGGGGGAEAAAVVL